MRGPHFESHYDVPPGMSAKEFDERILRWNDSSAEKARENSPEKEKGVGDMFLDAVNLVRSAQLRHDLSGEKQERLLKERKLLGEKLLSQLVDSVLSYTAQIARFERAHISSEERESGELISADRARRLAHDALIAHLQVVLRYMRENFAALPPEELENLEDRLQEEGKEPSPVERRVFPNRNPNRLFLPSWVSLQERGSVTRWAEDLQKDVSYVEFKKALQV